MLDSNTVPEEATDQSRQVYATPNPVKLGRADQLNRPQGRLDDPVGPKNHAPREANLEYVSS